ncbi:hypothetical protein [Phyllobacterium bourgognense]|uniref:hypothetical protein n=1 Tax=Phyllobacterium bourgognense TaxID=314236 RepID=UPI001AECE1CB|nr:hypothetical protein [Phyllobacterium bourgognense]
MVNKKVSRKQLDFAELSNKTHRPNRIASMTFVPLLAVGSRPTRAARLQCRTIIVRGITHLGEDLACQGLYIFCSEWFVEEATLDPLRRVYSRGL